MKTTIPLKLYITLIILLGISQSPAVAQYTTAEDLLLKQINYGGSYSGNSISKQEHAKLLKKQQLTGNSSNVVQSGLYNAAFLQQIGSGNVVNLMQEGNQNNYEGSIKGNNILSDIGQRGHGNSIVQDIAADNKQYVIYQQGNQNEVIQLEKGNGAQSYKVEQIGNGMSIIIQNGGVTPPGKK
ncbi:hypothetical protein [Pontibacter russatus]|uniref:hypothetical protein n=1 Tax=Pontibacter russatus TaxID=2694929 RepID=UPI00137AF8F7|nr:hypothetical protein [Pontibacter russatus]